MTDGERTPLIRPMSEYIADIPPKPDWVIEEMVYAGGLTLIAGAPKAGKSTVIADAIRNLKAGREWIGLATRDAAVLYLTEERGIAVRHKLGDLAIDVMDSGSAALADIGKRPGASRGFKGALVEAQFWAIAHPRGLVVIDTLAIWADVEDENSASEMTRAINAVKRAFYGTDTAVVLVHHTRKSGGMNGEAIRGSSSIQATVDMTVEVAYRTDNRSDDRVLYVAGRAVFPTAIHVGFDRLAMAYSRKAPESAGESELLAEMAYDDGTDEGGMTRERAREILREDPRAELKRLEKDGLIVARPVKVGRNKPLHYWRTLGVELPE